MRRAPPPEPAGIESDEVEGLEYVTGEHVYHSQDEMWRSEQQHEIEERAAEERVDADLGGALLHAEATEEPAAPPEPGMADDELVAHGALEPPLGGDEDFDEVPEPEEAFREPGLDEEELDAVGNTDEPLPEELEELLAVEEIDYLPERDLLDPATDDVDVQGRSLDLDKDWQGDPWDDPGRDRARTDPRWRG